MSSAVAEGNPRLFHGVRVPSIDRVLEARQSSDRCHQYPSHRKNLSLSYTVTIVAMYTSAGRIVESVRIQHEGRNPHFVYHRDRRMVGDRHIGTMEYFYLTEEEANALPEALEEK